MLIERGPRNSLRSLVKAHIVAIVVCAALADVNSASPGHYCVNSLFTALVASQLCLLGMAVVVAAECPHRNRRWLRRIAFSTLGVWMLTFVVSARDTSDPPLAIWLLAPAVSTVAGLFGFMLWAWGARLVRLEGELDATGEAFQFTLRHLLALTAGIAVLLAVGRAFRALIPQLSEELIPFGALLLLMISIVTASATVTTLWAMLGTGRPVQRLPFAVALAASGGLLPAYYFNATPEGHLILLAVAALISLITAASLAVVRREGYRLVRRPPTPSV